MHHEDDGDDDDGELSRDRRPESRSIPALDILLTERDGSYDTADTTACDPEPVISLDPFNTNKGRNTYTIAELMARAPYPRTLLTDQDMTVGILL